MTTVLDLAHEITAMRSQTGNPEELGRIIAKRLAESEVPKLYIKAIAEADSWSALEARFDRLLVWCDDNGIAVKES